jgi:hypothetical protein
MSQPVQIPAIPEELRVLVIGQSISSNCNEYIYGAVDNVLQIGKDGVIKAAHDPFEWADCSKGSMWMPLGKRIIEGGMAKKVIFMPIGVGGTKVRDWQEGGTAFGKLNEAISVIKKNGMKFDFVFWHQGSSDIGTSKSEYTTRLLSVIDYVSRNVPVNRWLIGIHSRCWGDYDPEVEAAQFAVANASEAGRFAGANSNLLGGEYRLDGCHLNQRGQEQMALMWLEAIRSANSRQ